MASCIRCGCTDDNACMTDDGPCWWVSENPPICSACADTEAQGPGGRSGEADVFCPASPVAAPHVPLFRNETQCYCARCRMPLEAA